MTSYIPHLTLPNAFFTHPASAILLPVGLGAAVGFSISSRKTQEMYMQMRQPAYRPPPWLFGPAWTVLYGLMGYSAYRAMNTGLTSINPVTRDLALHGATLYSIQLGLNLAWMPTFFKFKQPALAAVDIVSLLGVTSYLTYTWGQVDEVAGWALVPYLGWLGFATYLNLGVGYLNGWTIPDWKGKGRGY